MATTKRPPTRKSPKARKVEQVAEPLDPRIAKLAERIKAATKRGLSVETEKEGCRLRLNQIEFLLEGFNDPFKLSVRLAIFGELKDSLALLLQHLETLPCPKPEARAQAKVRYGRAGVVVNKKDYKDVMEHPAKNLNNPV